MRNGAANRNNKAKKTSKQILPWCLWLPRLLLGPLCCAPDKQCTLTASHTVVCPLLPLKTPHHHHPQPFSHILSLLCLLLLFSLRAARSSTFPGRLQIRVQVQTNTSCGGPPSPAQCTLAAPWHARWAVLGFPGFPLVPGWSRPKATAVASAQRNYSSLAQWANSLVKSERWCLARWTACSLDKYW